MAGTKCRSQVTGHRLQVTGLKKLTFGGYVLKTQNQKQNLLAVSFYSCLLAVSFHSGLLVVTFYLLVRAVLYIFVLFCFVSGLYVEYCPNQQLKANCKQTRVKANCKQTGVKANHKQVLFVVLGFSTYPPNANFFHLRPTFCKAHCLSQKTSMI